MKGIKSYNAPKYGGAAYTLAEDGVYKTEDNGDSAICYQEFAGSSVEALRKLRSIIGKRAYDKEGRLYVKLCIE